MQNMPDLSQLMQLAGTPEGQAFLTLLRNSDSAALNQAMQYAQAGDYDRAGSALSSLLSTPEAQKLMKKLGR